MVKKARRLFGIGSMHFKGGEQKLPGLPVNTSSSPTPSPTITQGRSPFFLLPSTRVIIAIPSIPYAHPSTSGGRAATLHYFSQTGTQNSLLPQRGNTPQWMHRETHQWTRISLQPHRKNCQTPRKERQLTGSPL